jgi:hypothetical protein
MRKLTFDQLNAMTPEEVTEYWITGIMPEDDPLAHIYANTAPYTEGRSILEANERRWATGRE